MHAGFTGLHAADACKNKKGKPANPDATGQLVRSAKATTDNCIAGASGNTQLFKLDCAEKMVVNVNG